MDGLTMNYLKILENLLIDLEAELRGGTDVGFKKTTIQNTSNKLGKSFYGVSRSPDLHVIERFCSYHDLKRANANKYEWKKEICFLFSEK